MFQENKSKTKPPAKTPAKTPAVGRADFSGKLLLMDGSGRGLSFLWLNFSRGACVARRANLAGRGQDARIFSALAGMGIGFDDLTARGRGVILCVRGPGSYTGLRLQFSFLAALKLHNPGLDIFGATSFELLAQETQKTQTRSIILTPSLRQDYFCALAENGKLIDSPRSATASEVNELARKFGAKTVIGGDAARFLAHNQDQSQKQKPLARGYFRQAISILARSYLNGEPLTRLDDLVPYYLRDKF